MENKGQSYGASYSGSDFDFLEFMKRPLTICRFLCIVSYFIYNFVLILKNSFFMLLSDFSITYIACIVTLTVGA